MSTSRTRGKIAMRQALAARYEIRVRGPLGPTMLEAFPGLAPRRRGEDTVLSGSLPDQAALFGVLYQIEALGLELVEIRCHHARPPAPGGLGKEIDMKALVLNELGAAPTLQEMSVPEVGPGQVRLRVKAAGLNKIDAMIASGMLKGTAEYQFPVVLGRDAAGIVDAVGDGVDHVNIGDGVIGHVPMDGTLRHGTLAYYAVVPGDAVVGKPSNLDYAAAAAVPLAGAAAVASVDAVEAGPASTLLIVGASGGVGSYAVQLAASRGATVIATALPDDADRARGLGASEIVNYREDIAGQIRSTHPDGIDGLIDLVSYDPDSLGKLAAVVRNGGRVASTLGAAQGDALSARGITGTNITVSPTRATLAKLVAEIEDGALRVDVEQTLSLEHAQKGLETLAAGNARGKLVVLLDR
jgi:NADPH:quinone reductase-like Zn-dependent oxidoreductase